MSIRTGARAPADFVFTLAPEDADDIDLSSVTAAEILVRLPDQTEVTWAATMSGQSATALTLIHEFAADGSDLPQAGTYSVVARLTVPGGSLDSEPAALPVPHRFDHTTR